MTTKTTPYDSAVILDTPEAVEAYLADAFEEGDPAFISYALGVVARALGMSALAARTGLSRPALYRALNSEGNPEFATILKVAEALGFKLVPHRISEPEPA